MAQTPLAASMPPDPSLSSDFLVKLSNLVKSINPPQKPSTGQRLPKTTKFAAKPSDVSDPCLCPADPHYELVPWVALEECSSELDEQLEEAEREIKALLDFWEHCFVDDKEDSSSEIPRISKWQLGHPLVLNDEHLREDPSYNEERVDQEALQDYLKELEEQRVCAALEQAASHQRDSVTSGAVKGKSWTWSLLGRHTPSAKALGSPSQGKPPTHKKPCVTLSVAGEAEAARKEAWGGSGSSSSSSEEEEATTLLEKRPKRTPLQGLTSRAARTHTGSPLDRSEPLQRCKEKVPGHYRHNLQQPVTGESSEKSETSSSSGKDGPPSKPYNFRCRSKAVSYVARQEEEEEEEEEEEKSSSEAGSEKDWLPEEEESDDEEEQEPKEMEAGEGEDAEVEREEREAGTGPARAGPPRRNGPKTARVYPCPECGREFSNSSNMRKHLLIHKGEFPYGCHVCGKSYADPSNLTKHQLTHMGERRHACSVCPKAFYVKSDLDAHLRRHQGIRPFACMECGRSFGSCVNLLAHMNVHVEGRGPPRPVQCPVCDKTFPGPKNLDQHRKRHKVCEDCGEVFVLKFKYKFHRLLHTNGICVRCGVKYTGTHLCQGPAPKAERPQCAALESPATVPQGTVASQPVDVAVRAGSQKQPAGPVQVVAPSPGTDGTSASASLLLPTVGQVRPSDLSCVTSLKELSYPAQTDVRTFPKHPVTCSGLERRGAEPSNLAPTLLQPSGFLQPITSVQPVTLSPAVAQTLILPQPTGLVTLQPDSQAGTAFPMLLAAPPMMVPPTDSHPAPLIVTVPLGPKQSSGSSPVRGAANGGWILLNMATLPPGTKIKLEIPRQKIALPVTAQICAVCQTKYLGKHHCRKLPQGPAEWGEEEEAGTCQLKPEESPTAPQQVPMVHLPCPQAQEEQEPWAKSHSPCQADSQATYTHGDGEEAESDMEEDCESEEGELPGANELLSRPVENRQEPRQSKRRESRYMCNVCDKRFVHQRSFKQHVRMHMAFACN